MFEKGFRLYKMQIWTETHHLFPSEWRFRLYVDMQLWKFLISETLSGNNFYVSIKNNNKTPEKCGGTETRTEFILFSLSQQIMQLFPTLRVDFP